MMHHPGYAIERKGPRKGIAGRQKTCRAGAAWRQGASGLQVAAPVSLCHDGEEKP